MLHSKIVFNLVLKNILIKNNNVLETKSTKANFYFNRKIFRVVQKLYFYKLKIKNQKMVIFVENIKNQVSKSLC